MPVTGQRLEMGWHYLLSTKDRTVDRPGVTLSTTDMLERANITKCKTPAGAFHSISCASEMDAPLLNLRRSQFCCRIMAAPKTNQHSHVGRTLASNISRRHPSSPSHVGDTQAHGDGRRVQLRIVVAIRTGDRLGREGA